MSLINDWQSFDSISNVLWPLCSTIFRARYSLLTLVLPPVLAALALFVWPRGTLYSLLLPRQFRNHEVSRRRALADLFWIAFASFCIATLACAGANLAATYGPERTPSYPSVAGDGTFASPATDAFTWPGFLLPIAVGVASIMPLACIVIWQREQDTSERESLDVVHALGCVAGGSAAAAALVLLLGILRQSLFGSADWILPLRPAQQWAFDCSAVGSWILTTAGAAFSAIGCREGYLDPGGRLRASQAELMLCVAAAGVVYGRSLRGLALGRKPNVRFCTAVYLLVCLGTVGVVLGGVAFWLDRYGPATPLVAGLVVTMVAWWANTDHFFELRPHRPANGRSSAAPALPSLAECFERRLASIPPDADGERTAIVITASGGGIQAAAWTAEVLAGLAERYPQFERSLCLLSGVSGGSVGTGEYLAGTYLDPPGETLGERTRRWDDIRNGARMSLLEQVAWGVAFADLPRLFTGWLPSNPLVDRGWAIEQLLETRLRFSRQVPREGEPRDSRTLRDLCNGVRSGSMPVPLFNATCVQTGQRVIMSPVRFASDPRAGSRSLHMPADYSEGSFQADPTLATAIRLSATFCYASPVARPTREDETEWKKLFEGASSLPSQPQTAARFDLHLCDGGYADNTGVVAATEACRELLLAIAKEPEEKRCRILFVRIEPFPQPEATEDDSQDGFSQVVLGPAFGLLSARVATQQERAEREIEQFIDEALEQGVQAFQSTFRFGDNVPKRDQEKPPLSWSLSSRQQDAIKSAWQAVAASAPAGDNLVAYAKSRDPGVANS
jgi:hypothetical protein